MSRGANVWDGVGMGLASLVNGFMAGERLRQMRQNDLFQQRTLDRQDALAQAQIGLERAKLDAFNRKADSDEAFMGDIANFFSRGNPAATVPPGPGGVSKPSASVAPGVSQWGDLISYWGRWHGLTPEQQSVIPRIMSVESGGNPWAHNKANKNGTDDFGLMQINSGNMGRVGQGQNVFDPSENIRIGTGMFKELVDQHNGDIRAALGAYNTGSGNPNAPYVDKVLGPSPAQGVQVADAGGRSATDAGNPAPNLNPNATMQVGGKAFTLAELANNQDFVSLVGLAAARGSDKAKGLLETLKGVREMTAPRKMDGAQAYEAQFGKRFDPADANAAAWVRSYNQANSTQSVNVHNNLPPEQNQLQKKQGEALQEVRTQLNKDAEGALKTLATLNYAEPLLDVSGPLAEIKKTVGGLAQALGLSGQFGGLIEAANDMNTLQALSAKMLLPIVQNTTAFHTNFSDADRRSIESMNISPQNLPEVNRRLLEIAREEAGLALEKQKHFTGLKDYADYESRLSGWNEGQAKRLEERRTKGRKAPPDANAGPAPGAAPTYKTPEDVRADFQAGRITQEQAASILRGQFGME